MVSIYDISSDLLELFQAIEEQEGEITEEQEKVLEIKEEELSDKQEVKESGIIENKEPHWLPKIFIMITLN